MAHSCAAQGAGHHPGFVARWLFSTNRKEIGTLYLFFAGASALVAVAMSVLMRVELMWPGMQLFADGQAWNAFVSTPGLVMIFFVVMPAFIGGFGNWLVPLMIGAPDMVFPGLTNISFWLLVPAIMLPYDGFSSAPVPARVGRPTRRSRLRPTIPTCRWI